LNIIKNRKVKKCQKLVSVKRENTLNPLTKLSTIFANFTTLRLILTPIMFRLLFKNILIRGNKKRRQTSQTSFGQAQTMRKEQKQATH
jgi:hypothetical protein